MSYIMINDEAFTLNTDKEIAEARQALADAGLEDTAIWAGEPDGLGDSYATGNRLRAATGMPSKTYKLTFADGVNATDAMQGIAHTSQALNYSNNDHFGWIEIDADTVEFVDVLLDNDDSVASYKEVP